MEKNEFIFNLHGLSADKNGLLLQHHLYLLRNLEFVSRL